jgi:hypothetical protein
MYSMERDIDRIIQQVKEQLPEVDVVQLQKIHPADDDGIWWFRLPGIEKDIQIESSYGNCPFIVETDELCCEQARNVESVDDAVKMVVEYLRSLE